MCVYKYTVLADEAFGAADLLLRQVSNVYVYIYIYVYIKICVYIYTNIY